MKVVFHEYFHHSYTSDPAAETGRMEAVVSAIPPEIEFIVPEPATEDQLLAVHTQEHINSVRTDGLYDIAAFAAGGAIMAARTGLATPTFGLIRPPGHHASADSRWGFCFFNNMAVALITLKNEELIKSALVLDIDLHYGDGTVNILGNKDWVKIFNPSENTRKDYLKKVETILFNIDVDLIGVSAGFDNHVDDWGGLMATEDYFTIGTMVNAASRDCNGGCFALFEGGYNHEVLGQNAVALIKGLAG